MGTTANKRGLLYFFYSGSMQAKNKNNKNKKKIKNTKRKKEQ
jgi:hypothetical protein